MEHTKIFFNRSSRVPEEAAGEGGCIERLQEKRKRKRIMQEANNAYEALWQKIDAAKQELEERALWEITLLDGLEEDT